MKAQDAMGLWCQELGLMRMELRACVHPPLRLRARLPTPPSPAPAGVLTRYLSCGTGGLLALPDSLLVSPQQFSHPYEGEPFILASHACSKE